VFLRRTFSHSRKQAVTNSFSFRDCRYLHRLQCRLILVELYTVSWRDTLRNQCKSLRISALGLTALTASLMVARADIIQSTVTLPPPAGAYMVLDACVNSVAKCVINASISDLTVISDTQVAGNEVAKVTALYTAVVTTDNGGSPGTPIAPVSLFGTMEFIYVGRDPVINPLGDFTTLVPSFDFTGVFNGNTQEVMGTGTTGTTSISEIAPGLYNVSSMLNFTAQFSVNGGPFIPAYANTGTLTSVPEPGYWQIAAGLLAGVLAIRRRRQPA